LPDSKRLVLYTAEEDVRVGADAIRAELVTPEEAHELGAPIVYRSDSVGENRLRKEMFQHRKRIDGQVPLDNETLARSGQS
jgi:hypothetical protein